LPGSLRHAEKGMPKHTAHPARFVQRIARLGDLTRQGQASRPLLGSRPSGREDTPRCGIPDLTSAEVMVAMTTAAPSPTPVEVLRG